jgi:hypothetical protein
MPRDNRRSGIGIGATTERSINVERRLAIVQVLFENEGESADSFEAR